MVVLLIIIIVVAILAAAYPIGHTFETLESGPPALAIQERNEKREGYSLIVLIACFLGGLFLIAMLAN